MNQYNWQDIKVSHERTHFLINGKAAFNKEFSEVLKFHSPGLAPVIDLTGAYHINSMGEPLYSERYERTFGYYCNRAAIKDYEEWFHLNEFGARNYIETYSWVGNYQEGLCPVRDHQNHYSHIDLDGVRIYSHRFIYAGDFKDGICAVKTSNGLFRHIDTRGAFINDKEFIDLGVFHKNYATAKDKDGWYHIDKDGNQIYSQRYSAIEPFYNGYALVTLSNCQKEIIDEKGNTMLIV